MEIHELNLDSSSVTRMWQEGTTVADISKFNSKHPAWLTLHNTRLMIMGSEGGYLDSFYSNYIGDYLNG